MQILLALCNAGKIKKVSRCKEILESKNKAFNEFDINECLELEGILSLKLLNLFEQYLKKIIKVFKSLQMIF